MADYTIEIPGNPNGVEMQIGDRLIILYRTPAKFCVSSGNANAFNPPLPVGVARQQNGAWEGIATSMTTIHFSSVGNGQNCGAPNPRNVGPGTIKVGTGK
jgi:hypothetical protein